MIYDEKYEMAGKFWNQLEDINSNECYYIDDLDLLSQSELDDYFNLN
jgi:hypothetical protein